MSERRDLEARRARAGKAAAKWSDASNDGSARIQVSRGIKMRTPRGRAREARKGIAGSAEEPKAPTQVQFNTRRVSSSSEKDGS